MFEQPSELSMRSDGSLARAMAPSTRDLLARLVDVATAAADNDRAEAKYTLEKALAMLISSRGSDKGRFAHASRGGLAPWQARRVAGHVREHIGTHLRASYLATLVKLSNSHFNRAFKVSFQDTPSVYIMRQRIRLAQDIMLTTSHPLSQIALQCGWCDQAHFSRMFRRFVGQSPRRWRRQYATDVNPLRNGDSVAH